MSCWTLLERHEATFLCKLCLGQMFDVSRFINSRKRALMQRVWEVAWPASRCSICRDPSALFPGHLLPRERPIRRTATVCSTYIRKIGHDASSTRQRKSQRQFLFDDHQRRRHGNKHWFTLSHQLSTLCMRKHFAWSPCTAASPTHRHSSEFAAKGPSLCSPACRTWQKGMMSPPTNHTQPYLSVVAVSCQQVSGVSDHSVPPPPKTGIFCPFIQKVASLYMKGKAT
jgi:hypothetical protein